MNSGSLTVNESVGPSENASFSDVVLSLTGMSQNLTYSRLVNASIDLFPYLPGLLNQSLSYSNSTGGYSISVELSNATSAPIDFGGASYQSQVYGFAFSATFQNQTQSGTGNVTVFPSTLVYSATAEVDGNYSVTAVLQATNLSLSGPSTQGQTAAYSVIGAGAAAAVVGVPLVVRHRRRGDAKNESKPLYWVD